MYNWPAGAMASAGGASLIQGPYSSKDDDMMEALSQIEDVHFVYVLRKRAEKQDDDF